MMDGILPIWKPKGITSHDCVFRVRKMLKMKKVGHTGTLDPEVEGVLPICLGKATKISSILMESKKVYEAEVTIGIATETEDQTGEIVEKKRVDRKLDKKEVENILSTFIGEIEQIPPMYSAIKVKGKKLYEYARKGIEMERPARKVFIHHIQLLSDVHQTEDVATFQVKVACSKGTYIRTLCVDIGKKLGYPAHMSHLIRTESGGFKKEEAITFEALQKAIEIGEVNRYVKTMDSALQQFDELIVSNDDHKRILNGQVLPLPSKTLTTNPFRIKTEDGELLALYQQHPDKPNVMKPFKMLVGN